MPDVTKYPGITEPEIGDEFSQYMALTHIKQTVEILLGIRGGEEADQLVTQSELDTDASDRLPMILYPGMVTETSVATTAWTTKTPFTLPPGTRIPVDTDEATKFVALHIEPRAMLYDAGNNIATPIPMEIDFTAGDNVIHLRAQNTASGSTSVVFGVLYTKSVL